MALISAHYRQSLDWNDKLISDCEKTLDKWYSVYTKLDQLVSIPNEILRPLWDDLNTPGYIANLHELFNKAFKWIK